ncbi:hypothetical protein ACFC4S_26765 [Priestia megaterium]|uniref:hypothetical protein n=1 Tax=Priestia megaterium TaxID=1404 RepID=UPI0035DAFDB5
MKKMLIGSLASSLLLISGCQVGEQHVNIPSVKADAEVKNYSVNYDLDVHTEGNKVKVTISMENKTNNPIPLITNNNQLFSVKLLKKDGSVLEKEIIDQRDRKQILRKEKVSWEVEFEANLDDKVVVESDLLLKSKKYQKYDLENPVQKEPVIATTEKIETPKIAFAPDKKLIYTYEVGKKEGYIQQKFQNFDGNKVQSFSEQKGVQLYSQESDGIYYLSSPDSVGDIDATKFIQKNEMTKIIPYPLVEGTTWTVGKKKYGLSDANLKVKTPLDTFDNCIEVTEIDKKVTRYYYYQKDIGLVKVKRARSKFLPAKTELQLVEIKDPIEKQDGKEEKKPNKK